MRGKAGKLLLATHSIPKATQPQAVTLDTLGGKILKLPTYPGREVADFWEARPGALNTL